MQVWPCKVGTVSFFAQSGAGGDQDNKITVKNPLDMTSSYDEGNDSGAGVPPYPADSPGFASQGIIAPGTLRRCRGPDDGVHCAGCAELLRDPQRQQAASERHAQINDIVSTVTWSSAFVAARFASTRIQTHARLQVAATIARLTQPDALGITANAWLKPAHVESANETLRQTSFEMLSRPTIYGINQKILQEAQRGTAAQFARVCAPLLARALLNIAVTSMHFMVTCRRRMAGEDVVLSGVEFVDRAVGVALRHAAYETEVDYQRAAPALARADMGPFIYKERGPCSL